MSSDVVNVSSGDTADGQILVPVWFGVFYRTQRMPVHGILVTLTFDHSTGNKALKSQVIKSINDIKTDRHI